MSYIGNTQQNQSYVPAVDFFSGNGSTTAFTLSKPVATTAQIQAVISNVPQTPGVAYTVSGSTITFTSAPPSGTANIYVYYTSPNTQVVQPGQGTVGSAQMASGVNFTAGTITFADSSTISSHAAPQVTTYASSSGTYTPPTGCKYIQVEMVGGGGGGVSGSNSGSPGTAGTGGGNTTFGTLTCNGGTSISAYQGNVGGTASIGSGFSGAVIQGGGGNGGQQNVSAYGQGGVGGSSAFGGGGASNCNAGSNTGAGGGGGGNNGTSGNCGPGGSAGGYIKAISTTLLSSYSWAVGAAGSGGAAQTNTNAGGNGGNGYIVVTAYF